MQYAYDRRGYQIALELFSSGNPTSSVDSLWVRQQHHGILRVSKHLYVGRRVLREDQHRGSQSTHTRQSLIRKGLTTK